MSQFSALDVLGVVAPTAAMIARPQVAAPPLAYTLVPGVAGAIAGYKLGDSMGHPVLGFLVGEAIGNNAYRLYRREGEDFIKALTNLGMTGGLAIGSLMWKKHPFFGALAGMAVAGVVTSFFKGSNAYEMRMKLNAPSSGTNG